MASIALVTGAARGIGRAIALRLARDGYTLMLVDLNADGLDAVRGEIEQANGTAHTLTGDISKLSEIERVVNHTAQLGDVGVLVNNAGRVIIHQFFDVTETEWDEVLTLDLKTVFFMMQCAARQMHNGGHIVNISSISGRSGRPDQSAYAAAKAGVISVTRSAALALAPQHITVNAICPGVVDTTMTQTVHRARAKAKNISYEESLASMTSKIPLGRLEVPEDVAQAVSFFCSPAADYITGQTLNVDGGIEMD